MSAINSVVLVGRLTRDPELKYTGGGTAVCTFTLAIDRAGDMVDGEAQAGFFDVQVWGNQGETCAQYLEKGRQCGVVGNLRLHKWEAQDGTKRSKVEVVGRQVQFLGSKSDQATSTEDDDSTFTPAAAQTDFATTDQDIPF